MVDYYSIDKNGDTHLVAILPASTPNPNDDGTSGPDGKTLASFSQADTAVKFWDIATGKERGNLVHANNLKFVHYTPKLVVTVDVKGVAKVWDLAPER